MESKDDNYSSLEQQFQDFIARDSSMYSDSSVY